ncbi:MAG: galactose-1-phosphate uridylyltransferase [Polyangiaceae bacterium]
MPEMRFNHVTGDWVIIAPERARRPGHAIVRAKKALPPTHVDDCPFCLGNEHETGEEKLRLAHPDAGARGVESPWQVRSVVNLYSALVPNGAVVRAGDPLHMSMTGIGLHEVIIESPDHSMSPSRLPNDDLEYILEAHHQRFNAFYEDPRVNYVVVFKNHGSGAGTSLEHPHSQIVGTPVVPAQIRERLVDALRFRNDTGECLFCATLRQELEDGSRIVLENRSFVAFIPYAAMSPFHLWVFPRVHQASFSSTLPEERRDLAEILESYCAGLRFISTTLITTMCFGRFRQPNHGSAIFTGIWRLSRGSHTLRVSSWAQACTSMPRAPSKAPRC